MRYMKKSVSILMAAVLVLSLSITVFAADSSDFQIESGVLIKYLGNDSNVVIPDGITEIGRSAFENGSIRSVVIPGSVVSIGTYAFLLCANLESVTLNDGLVNIGDAAFHNCPYLKSIEIPNGVISIGGNAFAGCWNLSSVTIPDSVTEIGEDAFYGVKVKLTIHGGEGSAAQLYALENGIDFLPVASTAGGAKSVTALPTKSPVLVNGSTVNFEAYNIDGNNYFKLRDLALALNGTEKQFEVTWNNDQKVIDLKSGAAYTAVGGELAAGDGAVKAGALNSSKIYKDGVQISLTAYTINGNNYFKLRDLGQAFDFGVTWDGTANTIHIDTSTGYAAEGDSAIKTASGATIGVGGLMLSAAQAEAYEIPVGFLIQSLTSQGPAELAGAKEGDVIVKLGGLSFTTSEELVALISAFAVGETVEMFVYRDGSEIKLNVTLAASMN